MNRVRSFAAPHKGLRHLMARFSLALGSADISNPTQLAQLKALGQDLFTLLTHHAQTENEHTLALLDQRARGASEHDRHDHHQLEPVQQALMEQLSRLTGRESADTTHQLYLNVSGFQSRYLEHIFEEETVTEVLLQQHFSDEELLMHRRSVMQGFALPMLELWLKYIIPAQQQAENVGMLSAVKAMVSVEAFSRILITLQGEMEAGVFQLLDDALQAHQLLFDPATVEDGVHAYQLRETTHG